jgi:peptide/nickel transport system permease protein
MAMLIGIVISVPLGIYAARHQNRPGDMLVMSFTQLGLATPEFWLGILLILLFAVKLGIFSAGGFPGWSTDVWGSLQALLLPAFALGVIRASILARLTRSSMLEVLREDYVRTARAKGLRERLVILKHAFRNALLPISTIIGIQLGTLFAGAVLTESIFGLAGVGRMLFEAITARDFPIVQAFTVVIAVGYVLANLLVDLSYAFIDPRIKLD